MTQNTNQTIITAVSIVVALGAITYAMMSKVEKPVVGQVPAMEITEVQYEKGANNPVVMTVDGREVTRQEVLDNFALSGSQLPEGTDVEQIFPLLQDQYLVGNLLKTAALENGLSKDTPAIAARVNAAYEQALRAEYINEMGAETVTDNDVKQAYEDIVKNSPAVEERRARHILVQDEAKAKEIIEQLNNGADFATLAEENSEGPTGPKGGDLGYFAREEMVPEFATAAFAIEVGKVGAVPVKTQFGYHVIKVEDSRERAKPDFETVKPQLEQQLRQAAVGEALQKLREKSEITVFSYNGDPLKDEAHVETEDGAEEDTSNDDAAETAPAPEDTPAE